ncbi:MAG TPA: radical SAM protein [bacterium]|nr:radical SAM protein [bacterium]
MTLAPVKPPRRALWEITWKCDLRCEHCLVEGGTAAHDELSPVEALDLVDQLADLGVAAVSLTGGEPFLRRDWRAIAEHVRRRGMALRFSANGHLLDDETVRTLVEIGAESFSVSIDGLSATHDRLRHGPPGDTRSSFALVVAALDRLRATPMLATVRTTITKQNIDELPALHGVLKEHGVQRWVLQLAHRTGRLAAERAAGVCDPIDPEQLPRVADFIVANADDPALPPRAFNNIGYLGRQEPTLRQSGRARRNPLWNGCSCGVSVVGIEPDGGIKGCANQVGEPFIVGNIRRERLADIWNDRPRWHWLHPKPEQMTGYCAGCALAKVCGAGCTTLAYRSTGELFNNPYCLRRLEREGQGVAR